MRNPYTAPLIILAILGVVYIVLTGAYIIANLP